MEEDTRKPVLLEEENKTLADYQIEDGDTFIVETMANDNKWPMSRTEGYEYEMTAMYSVSHATSSSTRRDDDDGLAPVGTVTYSAANPGMSTTSSLASVFV